MTGANEMADKLIMSRKERERKVILDKILDHQLSRLDGSKRLNLSIRQLRRVLKNYKEAGDAGLVHKSRGNRSTRAYCEEKKQELLSKYNEKYKDFGPTLASEKLLEEDKIPVNRETLRLWLKAAGLWAPRRMRRVHRTHRERRARFGELLQLDGSIHAWFDGEDKKQCLMNMVDDATGKTLALLDTGETTRAAFALLRWWIEQAGIPLAIYVDLKSLYISPKALRFDEEGEYVEPNWLTHFGRACEKLGIKIIKAYSPQAKGRVERSHAVYQDRFLKELKLRKIASIQEANELLSHGFINRLNEKFAKPARDETNAHIELLADNNLDQILCWEYTRVINNDWTVRFEAQYFQIEKTVSVRPKQKILVRKHMDNSVSLWVNQLKIPFHEIKRPEAEIPAQKLGKDSFVCSRIAKQNKHKTPWGQFNPGWLNPTKGPQTNQMHSES
jgi:transposase